MGSTIPKLATTLAPGCAPGELGRRNASVRRISVANGTTPTRRASSGPGFDSREAGGGLRGHEEALGRGR